MALAIRGKRLWLLASLVSILLGSANWVWRTQITATQGSASLVERLGSRVQLPQAGVVPCEQAGPGKPLHLLVLGQSNAANHGEALTTPSAQVMVVTPAGCALAQDPLPGATGRGGSIWSRLPQMLAAAGVARPLRFSVLAVDASSLHDWVADASPLRAELIRLLVGLQQRDTMPHLVLWQQGEVDARQGTSTADYETDMYRLAALLQDHGVDAPMLLAQSTRCRSEANLPVRDAVVRLIKHNRQMLPGPDTDTLNSPAMRHDGCHFSAAGMDAAARLWAQSIATALTSVERRSVPGKHALEMRPRHIFFPDQQEGSAHPGSGSRYERPHCDDGAA